MDKDTVGIIQLNGMPLAGPLYWESDIKCVIPYDSLSYNTKYAVHIEGFKDSLQMEMVPDDNYSFTTYGSPVSDAPWVLAVTPNGSDVALDGILRITFSKEMDQNLIGTVRLNGILLPPGGSWESNSVYTIPYKDLSPSTTYVVEIEGFHDISGSFISPDNSHSFQTISKDSTVSVVPTGIDVPIQGEVVVTFSEAMDTNTTGTVKLNDTLLTETGRWIDNKTFAIPYRNLNYLQGYRIYIDGFREASSGKIIANSDFSFVTLGQPVVTAATPKGEGVALSGQVTIQFDRPMDTTKPGTVKLNGSLLSGASNWVDSKTFVIPYANLAGYTKYTIEVEGFQDAKGAVQVPNSEHFFVTQGAKPLVTKVTPSGEGNPRSGMLVLTFDRAMHTGVAGTIHLNGVLQTGTAYWVDQYRFGMSYQDLHYYTKYSIRIDGFVSAENATMVQDNAHSFITETRPTEGNPGWPPTDPDVDVPDGSNPPLGGQENGGGGGTVKPPDGNNNGNENGPGGEGGIEEGGNKPGGNEPGGNEPGGNDPGGNEPGGENPSPPDGNESGEDGDDTDKPGTDPDDGDNPIVDSVRKLDLKAFFLALLAAILVLLLFLLPSCLVVHYRWPEQGAMGKKKKFLFYFPLSKKENKEFDISKAAVGGHLAQAQISFYLHWWQKSFFGKQIHLLFDEKSCPVAIPPKESYNKETGVVVDGADFET